VREKSTARKSSGRVAGLGDERDTMHGSEGPSWASSPLGYHRFEGGLEDMGIVDPAGTAAAASLVHARAQQETNREWGETVKVGTIRR
jgi:hypothetical protein